MRDDDLRLVVSLLEGLWCSDERRYGRGNSRRVYKDDLGAGGRVTEDEE